ncbi:MAG: hypothetical protein AAGA88_06780 [Pseudomonadota bacterium]
MGVVLKFDRSRVLERGGLDLSEMPDAEIVILPTVRIERHAVDLSHRVADADHGASFPARRRGDGEPARG